MANNYKCKHCGWTEGQHHTGGRDLAKSEYSKKQRGYPYSFAECGGFELSTKNQRLFDKETELTDFEVEMLEKRANESAAWGTRSMQRRECALKKNGKSPHEDLSQIMRIGM